MVELPQGVSEATFLRLYKGNLIPLHAVLVGLTWTLYDFILTLPDEVRYIWPQRRSLGKYLFLWIRYYTIFLLLFDAIQIHVFTHPGVTTDDVCVIIAPVGRIIGAISLWSVEILMQIRIYALFNRSKKLALVNAILFIASIGGFLWLLVVNSLRRRQMIAFAVHLPLPGCPTINGGTEWALWLSPMVYEFIMFFLILYKALVSISARIKLNQRVTLTKVLIQENIWYFFVVGCLLLFNNLMVIGTTKIPWFGLGPFHAAIGVVTCRMLLHLRKFTEHNLADLGSRQGKALESLHFAHSMTASYQPKRTVWLQPASSSSTVPTEESISA